MGQRFSACFVLKLAPQRGEGEEREGVQNFKPKHTEPLTQEIPPPLYVIRRSVSVLSLFFAEGPHSQVYAHTVTADNATVSLVDLGELGGTLRSTSFVRNDTLVTQLTDQETNEHTITSSRTRTEGEFESAATGLLPEKSHYIQGIAYCI